MICRLPTSIEALYDVTTGYQTKASNTAYRLIIAVDVVL